MSSRKARRLPILIAAFAALAVLLSGCVGVKPGTYKVTQPAGIGPVALKFTICTMEVKEAPPESPVPVIAACGPEKENVQSQLFVTLMVPTGTTTPEAFNGVPGPGAAATTFTRSAELTAQMNAAETTPGTTGPPPGFEFAGYVSGLVTESKSQEFTWSIETTLGLPRGAGGGTYGGPLKTAAIVGNRVVTPASPASRPINCKEEEPVGSTFCGGFEAAGEATLGVSDLKVTAPVPTAVVPGAKVKLPFVLDFASSAAELPKFKLTATSTLPDAELSLSNSTFTRGPSNATTNRATPTTRKAIVQVPTTAPLGGYELTVTATAAQGGATAATTTLTVKPKGSARVFAPKKVAAKVAGGRGIPVKLIAPIAGTRFVTVLKGPGKLLRKVRTAKEVGTIALRLRIPRAKADAILAAGTPLRLVTKIQQPGIQKPKQVTRILKLR